MVSSKVSLESVPLEEQLGSCDKGQMVNSDLWCITEFLSYPTISSHFIDPEKKEEKNKQTKLTKLSPAWSFQFLALYWFEDGSP